MIGIYKITSPTKKVYVGQSIDIEKRFSIYKRLTCKGQIKLYNSFVKHGVENHLFEILCECNIHELNEKERYYQDLYSCVGKNGLNLKLTKTTDRNCQISNETKLKISISNRISNAKKKGIYDENIDYSLKPMKSVEKIKYNHLIFYPLTNEYFKSVKDLYNKYTDHFYSYNSLWYNIKNNLKLQKHNFKNETK